MARRFKAPEYVGRPNPIALALRTTRAFGTRKLSKKLRYDRAKVRRLDRAASY